MLGIALRRESERERSERRSTGSDYGLVIALRLRADDEPLERTWVDIHRQALRLGYLVRNRRRWSTDGDLGSAAASDLADLLGADALKVIADAGTVEISMPWAEEQDGPDGWPARIMPWEFLLSGATRAFRKGPLTVIRRLNNVPKDIRARGRVLEDPSLLVESAPGGLRGTYDLSAETSLVKASLGYPEDAAKFQVVPDPDQERLKETVRRVEPGLLHFAGFDSHQAAELLGVPLSRTSARPIETTSSQGEDPSQDDGLALARNEQRIPDVDPTRGSKVENVVADQLADAFLVPRPPTLVSLNVYNSAARIAPRLIFAGAAHAIGFQDTIDDRIAEQFFSLLYRNLRDQPTDVVGAFRSALNALRQTNQQLQGACIVLWSGASFVDQVQRPVTPTRRTTRQLAASELISVLCEPNKEMNYSLLHNNRPLFKRLQIVRGREAEGPISGISVSVTLYVGEESFPFVRTMTIPATQSMLDLTNQVRVPLTSALMRTQGEMVHSVLTVEVQVGDEVVHCDTYPLSLAPVDQWTDTDENRLWLPSFVLPRDPAVAKIVQTAQRYLIAIQDDPGAGFDGYQSVGRADLPFAERYAPVDKQVRALWYALLERPITYINPPPSYANPLAGPKESPQRLRIPSEIVASAHGTCIDLALLMCACLEYVDIWPVIFLLTGHAFPGYWRSDDLHEKFQRFSTAQDVSGGDLRGGASSDNLETSYTVLAPNYLEIKALVDRGDLVPLEGVWLTNYSSFEESMAEGLKNLRSKREFLSMIDLIRARDEGVAPLPMLWSRP